MEFTPEQFFDLSRYKHAKIFENCEHVWDVLAKIEPYLKTQDLGKIEVDIPETAILVNKAQISIGKGTIVEPGAYIKGPCLIGENCTVRQGAYIRGNFICGDHCVIGHASEVKNSLFLDYAQAPHFAYVGDSVFGNHTNLGAGSICANLRFDNQHVCVHYQDKIYDTGRRKFGAIFGDGSQSGCNSVTNPGTLLGKKAAIYPCVNAHGFIPEGCYFRNEMNTCISSPKLKQ